MMEDDNLATILCSYFDNPDQEQNDETGWSEDAERGCDEVTQAIRDHFRPPRRPHRGTERGGRAAAQGPCRSYSNSKHR